MWFNTVSKILASSFYMFVIRLNAYVGRKPILQANSILMMVYCTHFDFHWSAVVCFSEQCDSILVLNPLRDFWKGTGNICFWYKMQLWTWLYWFFLNVFISINYVSPNLISVTVTLCAAKYKYTSPLNANGGQIYTGKRLDSEGISIKIN